MFSLFHPKTVKEIVLTRNGEYILDRYITRSLIKESISGTYELDFTLMVGVGDSEMYDLIAKGSIIKVDDEHGEEIFRIEAVNKDTKYIDVYCRQITIDECLSLWLEDVRVKERNGQSALQYLLENAKGKHELTVSSDIADVKTAYYIRKNLYEAIASEEMAFLRRWGGEIKRRGYNLYINSRIGEDKGFIVESRKNLTGFNIKEENTIITGIKPVGFDGITADIVYSENRELYPRDYIKEIKWENVRLKSEEEPEGFETLAEAQEELTKLAKKEFEVNKIDQIHAEYEINFIELADTEEYRDLISVQSSSIGDDITVKIDTLGVDLKARCTERTYSPTLKRRITTTISTRINTTIPPKPSDILQQIQQQLPANKVPTLADYIDSMITSGFKNSYYISRPNEALWLDNPDINKAQKVVRMNKHGLGFSQTGYYGKYVYGFTIDGKINADLITVGQLNGALIKAGTLTADKIEVSFKDDIKDQIQGEIQGDITDTILPSIKDEVTGEITNQVLKDYVTKSEFTVDKNGLTNKIEGVREEITTKVTESESNTDEKLKEVNKTITNLDTKFSTANGVIQQQVNGQSTTIQEIYKEVEGQGQQLVTTNKILSETKNSLTTDLEGIKANANRTDQVIKNINSNLSSVETRIYNAEQKITPKAITSTVRGSIEYKNDINGVSNRIEQVQSSLNVDLNGIRASVTRVDSAIKNTNADMKDVETRIYNAEQKITPTNIINQVNTAIRGGSQINSVSTILDKNGFTVKNGKLTIENNTGTKVLYGDTSGNLTLAGNIKSNATISGGNLNANNGTIKFDLNNAKMVTLEGSTEVGMLNKFVLNGTNVRGLGLTASNGGVVALSYKESSSSSNALTNYVISSREVDGATASYFKGANLFGNQTMNKNCIIYGDVGKHGVLQGYIRTGPTNKSSSTVNHTDWKMFGSDSITFGWREGSGDKVKMTINQFKGYTSECRIAMWDDVDFTNHKVHRGVISKALSVSIAEDIPFAYDVNGEPIQEEYYTCKTTQNLTEYIDEVKISEGEETYIKLKNNIAFNKYMVTLTPIGENKTVYLTKKEDDGFYIKGNECIVDYKVTFMGVNRVAGYNSERIEAPTLNDTPKFAGAEE